MPLYRLDERPNRHAVLADITCDLDRKLDQFIGHREIRRALPLYELLGKPYCLGVFLVGAYQEILGDLHNLFGDTTTTHVNLADNRQIILETIVLGDTVREVLNYVQYKDRELIQRLQTAVETAIGEGRIVYEEAGRFV